jgi:hypothetical protein
MKKQYLILILFCLSFGDFSQSQTAINADSILQNAVTLYYSGECDSALTELNFLIKESPKSDYYLLASQASALLKKKEKAFEYLNKAIETDTTRDLYYSIYHEHAFDRMHRNRKWRTLISAQKEVNRSFELLKGYNSKLRKKLAKIHERDQRHLLKIWQTYSKNNNKVSFRILVLALKQHLLHKKNYRAVKRLFAQDDYPSKLAVGNGMSNYPFLVIQHASLEVQEKYLPLLEKAATDGDLRKGDLALLIDRVRVGNNEKQVYGSQLESLNGGGYELKPIENYEEVNIKRKEVGLGTLEEYLKTMKTLSGQEVILPVGMDLKKIKNPF